MKLGSFYYFCICLHLAGWGHVACRLGQAKTQEDNCQNQVQEVVSSVNCNNSKQIAASLDETKNGYQKVNYAQDQGESAGFGFASGSKNESQDTGN